MAEASSVYPHFDADREIRLFRVRTPFWHRGRMKVDICTVNLSSPGQYIAISYERGSDEIVSKIVQDGLCIYLTKSAVDIIEYVIKKRRRKDWVWMDSVCVDQNNQAEKRRQVALMGIIYSSASQVIACIGPHFDGGDEALRFVPKVLKVLLEHEHSNNVEKKMAALLRLDPRKIKWTSLWRVLRSSFFERMWIAQEMIMAPSRSPLPANDTGLILTSRKQDLAYILFASVAQELRLLGKLACLTMPNNDKSLPKTLLSAQGTLALRRRHRYEYPQSIPVEYALYACMHLKAKHGVDKIYAVMNIVQDDPLIDDLRSNFSERFCREEDEIRLARAADGGDSRPREEDDVSRKRREEEDSERWNREGERLFIFVATTLLKRRSPYNLLGMAGIGWPARMPCLPSWVPDWNREDAMFLLGDASAKIPYQASLDPRRMPIIDSETNEMTVELILIDHVQRIFAHSTVIPKSEASFTEPTDAAPSNSLPPSWLTSLELSEIEAFPTHLQDYAHPVKEARQFALQSSHYERWHDSIDSAIMGPFLVLGNIKGTDIDMARAFQSWLRRAESHTSS